VGRVIDAIGQTREAGRQSGFDELAFGDRFPVLELTGESWKDGFVWPGIADRIVSKISSQQIPEVSGYLSPEDVRDQTQFRVFDALVHLASAQEPQANGQRLAATLVILGVQKERASFLETLLNDPRQAELARFAEAAVNAPEVAGLVSRIVPKDGARFEKAELEQLQKTDELIVRTSETGLGTVFRFIAHGEPAERLLRTLESGGVRSQLILALASAPDEIDPLLDKLAPAEGNTFTSGEIVSLHRLQIFLNGRIGRAMNRFLAVFGRNW
jgi:hypothetical protein